MSSATLCENERCHVSSLAQQTSACIIVSDHIHRSEPMIKPQWWMTVKPLADAAMAVVKSGEIKIRPESAERGYFRWMESLNDWCLSRQLWWGHQIPMYFATVEGQANDRGDIKQWFSGRDEAEALEKAKKALGDKKKFTLTREEDVLDTWFSSGLWP